MAGLIERISKLAKKRGIDEITIATDEGLPIVSTSEDRDRESGCGVYEIQHRLLKPDMEYLTIASKECMRILYKDDKFYYIVKSKNLINRDIIKEFRSIIDEEREREEREREERRIELRRKKKERIEREKERRRRKEERLKREMELKKKAAERFSKKKRLRKKAKKKENVE
ncbi:MAG TPA: hypothetical protein ENF58_03410 [Candidatus Altiarchaeales archaeon]|nr:hypothetical protein [Candidatus Altiarchaeales archaeon]